MTGSGFTELRRALATSILAILMATSGVGSPALADDRGRRDWERYDGRNYSRYDRERHREWRRERERRAEWRERRRHRDRDDDDDDDGLRDLLLPGVIGLGAGFLGGYLSDQYNNPDR